MQPLQHLAWSIAHPAAARRVRLSGGMDHGRLQAEHQATRELLARLERGDASPAQLRALLQGHFAFEEATLIPLLRAHLPGGTGPLPVLLEEHRTIRGLLDAMGDAPTPDALRRLHALLLSHLDKEEELILPFARTQLSPDELARVGCRPPEGGRLEFER